MGRGVHRGFITHEELFKSLGKRNLSQENLSQAFIHILDENIFLVEKKSPLVMPPNYDVLPIPNSSLDQNENKEANIKSLITDKESQTDEIGQEKNDQNFEKNILEEGFWKDKENAIKIIKLKKNIKKFK